VIRSRTRLFQGRRTGLLIQKEGDGLPPPFTAGMYLNDPTPPAPIGGTLAGDEDIVAGLPSIDPNVTESRGNETLDMQRKGDAARLVSHAALAARKRRGTGSAWAPEY